MPRYIDADKANVEEISCYYGSNCYIEDVQEWLNELPTADVVEVVRCEKCKYSRVSAWKHWCCNEKTPFYRGFHAQVEPDGFCSYGERRTDG